jgi:hypothetical protein
MKVKYDFAGWATKNNIKCADGRTILKDAFKECNGHKVPLVWNHMHSDPENILGHALLENRQDGVYSYCTFNDSESGQNAKLLVQHGDIESLSIYANKLVQDDHKNVSHGVIREVSLVLAGANPEANIDNIIQHGEEVKDKAIIKMSQFLTDDELMHGEIELESQEDKQGSENPDEGNPNEKGENTNMENQDPKTNAELQHADDGGKERTVGDVLDTLNDEQMAVVEALIAQAAADATDQQEDSKEDKKEMKQNAFDRFNEDDQNEQVLIHDALNQILDDAEAAGGLKKSYIKHAAEYGIEGLELLNPEYEELNKTPQVLNTQPTGWISTVISGVHNTPFAKVRMTFADITGDEARARGYIKGKYKKEEVISLLRRQVNPTTIYKKQKFDRDDLIDVDFDVIPWIKNEMNIKLDEEKARAYIFGDGRSSADEDKIREDCIIPVIADEDLFTIKYTVTQANDETLEHALITAAVLAQDDYQGSGNTVAFIEAKQVSKMLLMEDKFGHRLYPTINELASAMGVGKIERVPAGIVPNDIYGVILDLSDYNVGMKNMGQKNFFDDFDINYNQNIYLLETRQSAALTRPYSAIVLKKNQ